MLIVGPMGTLATARMEYLRSILSAIGFGTDGALMTGSVASGVAEGGSSRGQAFFRNDSRFSVKDVGKSKPSYTILFSSITGENKQSYPVTSAFPSNGARNACWHFLAQSLGLVFPRNGTRNAVTIFLNTCRNIPQAHGYIVVAFHPQVFWYRSFIFFPRKAWCKSLQ